jgi:hypothetical protein
MARAPNKSELARVVECFLRIGNGIATAVHPTTGATGFASIL